ncbi:MAG: type III secretion system chaperone [Gammaproteobacteria bacterium]|nr:type III secretion system chaperone [Gammaproteobacteria bacterium]MCY4210161.1 type III secretion system chaperone [Gammaproteobacteria bacterium]MCY4283024.1 type III secretion system chaperone [Gammaproteobacteria bacterium]MCY4337927.1 type III secretion system chaperone [Gammaproteobacteria bacterium]
MSRNFDNLLAELGAAIGIPELCANEDNICKLLFDEVAVSLELCEDNESFYICCALGQAGPDANPAQLAALLDANYLFSGTGGATLGVDKTSGSIVMIRSERLSALRQPQFLAVLEEFVNLAEFWQARLLEPFTSAEQDAPTDAIQDYGARV